MSILITHNLLKYDTPITSSAQAAYCRAEAERRYEGELVRDSNGMLIVRQSNGIMHTDNVLRALSVYRAHWNAFPRTD